MRILIQIIRLPLPQTPFWFAKLDFPTPLRLPAETLCFRPPGRASEVRLGPVCANIQLCELLVPELPCNTHGPVTFDPHQPRKPGPRTASTSSKQTGVPWGSPRPNPRRWSVGSPLRRITNRSHHGGLQPPQWAAERRRHFPLGASRIGYAQRAYVAGTRVLEVSY